MKDKVFIFVEMSILDGTYKVVNVTQDPRVPRHIELQGTLLRSQWSDLSKVNPKAIKSDVSVTDLPLHTRVNLDGPVNDRSTLADLGYRGLPLRGISRLVDVAVHTLGNNNTPVYRASGTPFVFVNSVLWVPPLIFWNNRIMLATYRMSVITVPQTWIEYERGRG